MTTGTALTPAADEGRLEAPVRPAAWSPALTYPEYEKQRVWANGEPRPEDMAYWKGQGLGVTLAYTAEQVRYMLEGAWCAGYYHAGYTHDSAYAEKQAEQCADEFLGPNGEVRGASRPAGEASISNDVFGGSARKG